MSLTEIAKEISTCQKCILHETRTNTVPGEGPEDAKVVFIGEGPGQNEDEQGIPFCGAAGKYLDELLKIAGLERLVGTTRSKPSSRANSPDGVEKLKLGGIPSVQSQFRKICILPSIAPTIRSILSSLSQSINVDVALDPTLRSCLSVPTFIVSPASKKGSSSLPTFKKIFTVPSAWPVRT